MNQGNLLKKLSDKPQVLINGVTNIRDWEYWNVIFLCYSLFSTSVIILIIYEARLVHKNPHIILSLTSQQKKIFRDIPK